MKYSRLFLVVFLVFLFSPTFIIPTNIYQIMEMTTTTEPTIQSSSPFSFSSPSVPQVPREIRVAIYDEPNTTTPNYMSGFAGLHHNNVSGLATILSASPFVTVTVLDVHDIYNHELITANFDVFAMVDNLPRENITNQVQEFWLGGGGILSFDGSSTYLCALGILPPEAIGTSGNGVYWNFISNTVRIDVRHPISKGYAVNDLFPQVLTGYLMWDWTALQGSVIASDLIRVASDNVIPNGCNVLAYNPTDRGGRIVTLAWDLFGDTMPALDQMIRDSVDWLCPRPKARVAFDLTHRPYYGVDAWDDLSAGPGQFSDFRNSLVSRTYTFDKLYPSALGNLTGARLAPYDTLITVIPDTGFDYTGSELIAITNWVQNGGSLFVIAERYSWNPTRVNYVNNLLTNLHIQIDTPDASDNTQDTFTVHPTTEGCTSLNTPAVGTLNFTGTGYGIWGPTVSEFTIGASEPVNGRVIVASDINFLTNSYIGDLDNYQYGFNVINWLSSARANVLIYTDWGVSANYYLAPLPLALNSLQVKYYLCGAYEVPQHGYWNFSLHLYEWDLAIMDNPSWTGLDSYFSDIIDYIDAGNLFILSYYYANGFPTHPLWAKLGCSPQTDVLNEPPLYIWDTGHDIFNQPIAYGANNFTAGTAYIDDGDRCTVFSNATALGGYTSSPAADEAFIILRNDEQTLFNAYLIDEFTADTDDSTYPDNMELWTNEVAFMLRPKCAFTPVLPPNATLGEAFPVTVEIFNDGPHPAFEGTITIGVPGGLGTLLDPPTQGFTIPPGGADIVTWHINVTDTGNFTLSFAGEYHGLPGSEYSFGFTGDIEAVAPPTIPTLPPPPIPGFPIEAIALGALIALGGGIVYRRRKR